MIKNGLKIYKATLLFGIFFWSLFPTQIYAQETNKNTSFGVATSVQINDKNISEGDIVSSATNGYVITSSEYDVAMFGVVTKNPAIVLENTSNPGSTSVITSGASIVKVSTANGAIKKDDLITSSNIRGVGVKATRNGFVLGNALESYSSSDKNNIGTILISVNPHFNNSNANAAKTNLIQSLRNAGTAMSSSPIEALRYVIAGIIALLSFIFGFLFFGRISVKGVEALGRNPLAARAIQLSVIVNVVLTVAIISVGLGIAYLILMF